MRLINSSSRFALISGAAVGLLIIGACSDSSTRALTAPPSAARGAVIASGGFAQAKKFTVCVDASAPAGTYTFKNIALDLGAAGPGYSEPLDGNGYWDGTYWNDPADGGDGTTVPNANLNVNYTISPGGCVDVLTRTVGNAAFMAKLPIAQGGTCDPSAGPCGGVNDSFAGANVQFVSASNGYVFDKADCLIDNGSLMPQHITSATGNPSPWPSGGFDPSNSAFATYGCGTGNNPTRGFANYEHGETVTFFFKAPAVSTGRIMPTATTCEDYAKNLNAPLTDILVGFKNSDINSVAPGVFFYYAHITKGAGDAVGIVQSVSPNPAGLPLYNIMQTQAYLYTYNGSKCTVVATLGLTNGGTTASGGSSLAAGNYILGVKYATDAPKGLTVSNAALRVSGALLATHNYEATIGGSSDASTSASVNTRTK